MLGVKVVVVGADDNGLLARTLARHSAKTTLLTTNKEEWLLAEELHPKALDMTVVLCDDYGWELAQRKEKTDVIVLLNIETKQQNISGINIEYRDGKYHKIKQLHRSIIPPCF